MTRPDAAPRLVLPLKRELFYDGAWHPPRDNGRMPVFNPATSAVLMEVSDASPQDVDAAVAAAKAAFAGWRRTTPSERAKLLREIARLIRQNAQELGLLDAVDSGNPYRDMLGDTEAAAQQVEFFAGLVTEMKGSTVPMGPDALNFSMREPRGVVARILPFNHPLMFFVGKTAAILAAGNTVVVKPAEQTPLTALRLMELAGHVLPPGVLNVLTGGRNMAAYLAKHADVAMIALVGSVAAGRSVMHAAADTIKPVLLELGGKNALIAFPDADVDEVAQAVVAGMNFAWCGQSCGSTSRAFLHARIHDAVLERIPKLIAHYQPGDPSDPATTMGAIASRSQYERVLGFIELARREGARLILGGGRPARMPPEQGWFIEPTVFADVTAQMTIAREEIFGPVLSVLRWNDRDEMLGAVNRVEYGLTCSIWTDDLETAHRTAQAVEAGFVWINEVAKHFLGAPFGGYKQSGLGREECLDELLSFTQEKNVHVRLRRRSG